MVSSRRKRSTCLHKCILLLRELAWAARNARSGSNGTFRFESCRRSYETLRKFFPRVILENQNVLGIKENWSKVLALVPDESASLAFFADFLPNPHFTSSRHSRTFGPTMDRQAK